jgi:hypothetical protein
VANHHGERCRQRLVHKEGPSGDRPPGPSGSGRLGGGTSQKSRAQDHRPDNVATVRRSCGFDQRGSRTEGPIFLCNEGTIAAVLARFFGQPHLIKPPPIPDVAPAAPGR